MSKLDSNSMSPLYQQLHDIILRKIQEDYVADQLTLFEEYDPFTGEKNKKN